MGLTLTERTKAFVRANLYQTREGARDKVDSLMAANAITNDEYDSLILELTDFYDNFDALPEVERLRLTVNEQTSMILTLNDSLTGFIEFLFTQLPELNPEQGV